jgi:hypothetical protein
MYGPYGPLWREVWHSIGTERVWLKNLRSASLLEHGIEATLKVASTLSG